MDPLSLISVALEQIVEEISIPKHDAVVYCIVLCLYIYIVLLAMHTSQMRFQYERRREKRAVLRERKKALGSPVNKVDRVEGRGWIQSDVPMIEKARV